SVRGLRPRSHRPAQGAPSRSQRSLGHPSDRTGLAQTTRLCYIFVEEESAMAETQISAYISAATRQQVERYVEAHGVKKGHLIEEALLHHLQALRELPADIVIPPRLVVAAESFEVVARLARKARRPTKAMRDLMAGKRVDGEP